MGDSSAPETEREAVITARTAPFSTFLSLIRVAFLAGAMLFIDPTRYALALREELLTCGVIAVGVGLACAHARPQRLSHVILVGELPLAIYVAITRPEAMPLAALGMTSHLTMASILQHDDPWLQRWWTFTAAAFAIPVGMHLNPVTVSTAAAFTAIALLWSPSQRNYLRKLGEAAWHRGVVDVAGVIMFEEDPRRGGLLVSPAAERLLGYAPEAFNRKGFIKELFHPDDAERFSGTHNAELAAQGEMVMRLRRSDGEYMDFLTRVQSVRDSHGRHERWRGVLIDITHWQAAELASQRFGELAEVTPNGQIIYEFTDPEDHLSLVFRFANPAALEWLGLTADELPGRSVYSVFDPPTAVVLARSYYEVLTKNSAFVWNNVTMPNAPGRIFESRAVALPGNAVGCTLEDVTDRRESEEMLRLQALHDPLTGLPNRLLLRDRVEQALRQARRGQEKVALLLIDLDQFKEVNDTLGHHFGDRLLVELSDRIRHELRDSDTFARLGGDEFAILLTDEASIENALQAAQRVLKALDRPFLIDAVSIQAGASIGIAVYPDHGDDAETLNRYADVAMYQAKRSGVRVALYDPETDKSSVRRMTILGGLRDAIDAGELELFFQPILDLRTGRVTDAEALVRWRHPTQGLLSPDEFIELAELSGVIHPLTKWVISETVKAMQNLAEGGHRINVSANVSARNLYDETLVPFVADLISAHPVTAGRLVLEITESELMSDPVLVLDVLGRMRDLGVESSMDDFGTGYSSLSHLKLLPISSLKIDRSFVQHMATDGNDATIVRSTIDLGHNLGLKVTGEGVEDMATLLRLTDLGCDKAQGYLLSRPVPFEQFLGVVEDVNAGRYRSPEPVSSSPAPFAAI